MNESSWADLIGLLYANVEGKPDNYRERLKFEIAEIEKQGAESIWLTRHKEQKKFISNPNNLIIPWLLAMVNDDPILARTAPVLNTVKASKVLEFKEIYGNVPHDLIKDSDSPDIDIDCLPEARDPLKEYAIKQYGQNFDDGIGSVCSVGTWQTYKFKSAIIDASVALGLMDRYEAERYTTQMPDEVDELKDNGKSTCKGRIQRNGQDEECGTIHGDVKCPNCDSTDTDGPTIGKLINEQPIVNELATKYPQLVENASNLVGRIRSMGMHAGAIIITDRPLYGNVPLAKSGRKGYWVSMWTEGRSTQLSKFGYIKWDLLGLKTLEYIFKCCQLIERNRGISFGKNMSGWDDINPLERRAGHFFDGSGNKRVIDLDDPHVLKLANEQKTDGVFQFDTDLSKCCAYDSKIVTEAGLKLISCLEPNVDAIQYLSNSGPSYTNNYRVVCSGKKMVYKVKIDDGRVLRLTAEHRVLTANGYKMVEELEIGDEIVEC